MRDSHNPYPTAQDLFSRGQAEGNKDMFSDVFKKDFIEAMLMKAQRKLRKMRINPYPDAIIRRGLHKKEHQETADPILEEAMMYTLVVGMEMLCGMADIIDTVDRMVLEELERKVEVDSVLIQFLRLSTCSNIAFATSPRSQLSLRTILPHRCSS